MTRANVIIVSITECKDNTLISWLVSQDYVYGMEYGVLLKIYRKHRENIVKQFYFDLHFMKYIQNGLIGNKPA